jgi:hypothetical protein
VPLGRLISRAAGRYLAGAARTAARELVLEARRRSTAGHDAAPSPAVPARRAAAVSAAWWLGVFAFVLVILNADLLLPHHGPRAGFRIGLSAVLVPAGLVLAFDRERIRPLLLARFRVGGRGLRRAGSRLLVGAGLRLLGVVWVGAGVFDLLRGLRDLI